MRSNDRPIALSRRALGLLVVPLLIVMSCGSDGSDDDSNDASAEPSTEVDATAVEVFDTSVVHEVSMTYDQDDYDAMIDTFTDTGEKEWIEVTVTIDGETYEQAGARLKGNSSLAGLGGGFGGGFGGPPGAGTAPDDTTTAEETVTTEETATTEAPATTEASATDEPTTEDTGGGPVGVGPSGSSSADAPEDLPWLIRLDQFVDGQDHQGYEDLVVRSNGSETSLNEAVALDLLEEAGLASQDAVATSFTVNDGEPTLRLIIEHPDDDAWYETEFDSDGALYKAESTGDWSYRGDDPAAYEDVFDQEGGSDVTDLTPLIDFLQFINESDDQTFADELPERLDVEAFATYLAMMDLLGNFDDIDGPGNNAYLWYDAETEQFTVVPWDLNLALGGLTFGFGGGNGPGGDQAGGEPPTDPSIPEGLDPEQLPEGFEPPEGFDPSQLPEGFEPPEGFDPSQLPEGFEPPEGFDPTQLPGGGGGGGFGRSNKLVERFHANADFEELYQQALTDLRASLYDSGLADEILAARVATLDEHATDLVDSDTITSEADTISAQFTDDE